jgi:Leucine-rich repeat (LRR) protein
MPDISAALARPKLLRVLDMRYNSLAELNVEPVCSESLVVINASHNKISSLTLPRQLASLAVINLSYNLLHNLPENLNECTRLQQMCCSHNCIAELPATLGSLPVVDLFLAANKFTCVPRCICIVNACETLSILAVSL